MAKISLLFLVNFLFIFLIGTVRSKLDGFSYVNIESSFTFVASNYNITDKTRFLIYDVNPGEGFNLRRDVYGRVANFVKDLNNNGDDWIIVLPPWMHLYHWKSRYISQHGVQWTLFFDLKSMNLYVPVIEFMHFIQVTGSSKIDKILYLQRHPDNFKNGFKDLVDIQDCIDTPAYVKGGDGDYHGYFWMIKGVSAKSFDCVSVQGHASALKSILSDIKARSVFVDRFESVLHMHYGSTEFYKPRRSLVFAKHLRKLGNNFRAEHLDSDDKRDATPYAEDWRDQTPEVGSAKGGPYVGVHMRRGDFAYSRKEIVPTIQEYAREAEAKMKKYNVKRVYLATDANEEEIEEFKSHVNGQVYMHPRQKNFVKVYKDGGVAIIDQWIVAHARYFFGTCSSTFSFRIYEERDILGFSRETTHNCFCRDGVKDEDCEKPGSWFVKF